MKYIVALLPTKPDIFVDSAHQLFGSIAQDYLLSSTSLPHITLAQFNSEDTNVISYMWHDIKQITDLPHIQFLGIGFTKKTETKWNASLMVTRTSQLIKLHCHVLAVLKKHSLEMISPSGDLYRPHLTLARIKTTEDMCINFNKVLLPDMDFTIAIGTGDEHGQFIKTLFS